MRALRLAAFAAAGAVVAWVLKAIVIAAAGGLDQSALESPLFILGLLLISIAFAAGGFAAAEGRGTAMRAVGVVGGVVVGLLLFILVETAVGAVVPDSAGWVKEEAGLWVASVVTAAIMLGWLRRRQDHQVATTSP